VRNRGYLVFATDPSKGVDSAEYQQVYATEARALATTETIHHTMPCMTLQFARSPPPQNNPSVRARMAQLLAVGSSRGARPRSKGDV
jgi:hypothetical protein